jgi:hypothetical protein
LGRAIALKQSARPDKRTNPNHTELIYNYILAVQVTEIVQVQVAVIVNHCQQQLKFAKPPNFVAR